MLLLLFRTGESLFAFDAKRISAVVPRVAVRAVPNAPAYLTGLMHYRGQAVPIVDFGVRIGSSSARDALNTRVVLTEFSGHDGTTRLIGVVAENVSHVRHVEAGQVVSPAMTLDEAPYLGEVLRLDEGLVQLVSVDRLLTDRMQDALYGVTARPEG